jgi:hypothetical protein
MSRPASGGAGVLMNARQAIASARTVDQLRQAQAVVLPRDHGLSLAQTARVLGVLPGWACQLRRRFIQGQIAGAPDAPTAGGRKRQHMTLHEECGFLAPFLAQAAAGGVLVVGQIKAALDKRLAARWRWPRPTTCCTATTGEARPRQAPSAKRSTGTGRVEKKLSQTLARIRQDWAQGKSFKLMFQDEARFGRISDVRRCWAPKPLRPLCQAMLTHEYTYA